MATVALIAVGILALLVAVLFAALVELYRDVRQLRDVAGILDRPLTVEIGAVAGTPPSRHGLPAVLDGAASALVVFLSERCATCRALAASFDGSLPAGLWLVVDAADPLSAARFLEMHRLGAQVPGGRVIVDVSSAIARSIGLDTTPVGFRVDAGRITGATTIPSARYLSSVLPHPIRLKPTPSTEWREAS